MATNKDVLENRVLLLGERAKEILERFRKVTTLGINEEDKELLKPLEDVNNYWEDALRPALLALSFEAVGGCPGKANNWGLVTSLLGAGIGIHDDIIDKSLTKHFRKTILGTYGLNSALLIGDLLIIKALTGIRNIITEGFEPHQISEMLKTYESFLIQICKAQYTEIRYRRNLNIIIEDYQEFLMRSIAEMEACARLGAMLGNGSEKEIETLAGFGKGLGFMMRLFSDMIDSLNIEGNLDQRLENESVPLPVLYAAKVSEKNFRRIKKILEKPQIRPEDIRDIPKLCYETRALKYMYTIAQRKAKEICENLRKLNDSEARDTLLAITEKSLANIARFSTVEMDQPTKY